MKLENWDTVIASGAPIQMVLQQPNVASVLYGIPVQIVEGCSQELQGMRSSVQAFTSHAARNPEAVRFTAQWSRLFESFKRNPTPELIQTLQRQIKHVKIMENSMRRGRPWHRQVLSELLEETGDLSGFGRTLTEELDLGGDHKSFVKAFEKEFKIKVQRSEPVSNGVYLYIDAEDTEKLNSELRSFNDFLDLIAGKMGYICVRRGQPSDIDYGPYSDRLSRWIFVRSPGTGEEDEDQGGETLRPGPKMTPVMLGDNKVRVLSTAHYNIWEDHTYGFYARGIGRYRDKITHRYTQTLSEAKDHADAEVDRLSKRRV